MPQTFMELLSKSHDKVIRIRSEISDNCSEQQNEDQAVWLAEKEITMR